MTRSRSLGIACAALAALLSMSAEAAQLGFYAGGLLGATDKNESKETYETFTLNGFYPAIGFVPDRHVSQFDSQDQGYSVLLGYRIHRHFAIEAVYSDFGDVEYRAQSDGTTVIRGEEGLETLPLSFDTTLRSEMNGIGAYALGIWTIGTRWELYGRAGVQYSTLKSTARIRRTGGTDRVFPRAELSIPNETAWDYAAGIGVAMSVAQVYGLRLEFLRVFDPGEDDASRGDADMLSLGFIVAF